MNIILLGAPGSGKGTQSVLINKNFGLVQLSTGEIIRENIEKKTKLGLQVQNIVDKGEFVSDDIILDIISVRILEDDCKKGFVLDGFPRNLNQATKFDELLIKYKKKIDFVIELSVSFDDLYKRIENRAIESNEARADDKKEILENRLKIYENQTRPLVPYYKKSNLHYEINGMKTVKEISNDINNILDFKKNDV
ncbi:MAG: adenylate kinase [SAR116 cluster bacterium]|nr:adenylate kinase [SAR116 cluster bacterium]